MKYKLILLAVLLTAFPVFSAEYYVDASHPDDTGDGASWATAKKTIQAAVNIAVSGDVVRVAAGTYVLSSQISVPAGITVQGAGAGSTIVDGNNAVRCFSLAASAVVSDLTITKGRLVTFGSDGGGVVGGILYNCTISSNAGYYGGGAKYSTLYNCTIVGNSAIWSGGGGDSCVFHNCLIINNTSHQGGGTCQGVLYNCTVSGNENTGGGARDGTFYNSIIYPDSVVFTIPCPAPRNCWTNDPMFVNSTNGNFRLQTNSPCIEAGDNSYVSTTTDLDGNARIVNGTVDIGAYELLRAVVATAPAAVTNECFWRTGPAGTRDLEVWNAGGEVLAYSLSEDAGWLTLNPTNGTSAGEHDAVQMAFDATGLAAGTYFAMVVVSDDGGVAAPVTNDVVLIVKPLPPAETWRNDFDGDGKADIGCYFAPGGMWHILKSTDGYMSTQFGYAGTLPVTGDFDGDGKADFGCYDPPTGGWFLFCSTEGFKTTQFGYAGTLPVTGDFDGDGKTDIGCYDPPTGGWFLFQSTEGFKTTQFGYAGTLPVTGDFDGDGKTDIGCYDPPTGGWFFFRSQLGFVATTFGYAGTVPVTGDFDGDGLTDFGCYDAPAGAWFFYKSKEGFGTASFGFAGTMPVTGDYDGDGLTDFGCYHAPAGNWFLQRSSAGFLNVTFGYNGTVPIGN